jgi:HAD superfamily phosphoserine phosphatase-like hydrolase
MHNLYREELVRYVRPQARAEVERHKRNGLQVIIASASFLPLVREAARDFGANGFICTNMEIRDGCYTGKTVCEPPEGEQKLKQFRELCDNMYGAGNWILEWAYGDHFSDVPLLETANHAIAIDPCRRLERIAKSRNWVICEWSLPR